MNPIAALDPFPASAQPGVLGLRTTGQAITLAAAQQWRACAGVVADLAPKDGLPARRARLHISFGPLSDIDPIWGAYFCEVDAPAGVPRVDWVLPSPVPFSDVGDVLRLLLNAPDLVTAIGCK